jgi:hypothetical protein
MADLGLCGISLDLQALDDAQKAIEDALANLTSGAGGIADSIASLQSELGGALDDALGELNGLIPEIKAELPNLQKELNELVGLLGNPLNALQIDSKLAEIREVFGEATSGFEDILKEITGGLSELQGSLAGFTGDLTAKFAEIQNALSSFDICKAVPNIDATPTYDEDGNINGYEYTTKAYVPDVPTTDAIKLPTEKLKKGLEEVALKAEDVVNKAKPTITAKTGEIKKIFGSFAPPQLSTMPKNLKTESVPVPEVMGGMQVKFMEITDRLSEAGQSLLNSGVIEKTTSGLGDLVAEGFTTNEEYEASFFAKRDKLLQVKRNQLQEINDRIKSVPKTEEVTTGSDWRNLPSESTGDVQKDAMIASQGFNGLFKDLGGLVSTENINSGVSSFMGNLSEQMKQSQKELNEDIKKLEEIKTAPKPDNAWGSAGHHTSFILGGLGR